jgi:hypothetical protein
MEGLVGELSSAAFGSGEDAPRPPPVLALAAHHLALRPAFSLIALEGLGDHREFPLLV